MTGSLDKPHEADDFAATLQRAAGGDERAWREIVDTYSRRVFGLIKAQCGNADLAEEITQSTFCTIVSKIESYTEQGRFESWLFHIAMNRLRDEMRRRKRQATPVEHETLAGLAPPESTRVEAADVDDVDALSDALSRLSEADRRVVHLRHFAGLTFKQIAALLDQPLGTVLARQHRALKKLRGLLVDDQAADGEDDAEGTSAAPES